jgi:hypothetical protein
MKTTIGKYADTYNNYIHNNVNVSYVKKNFVNILFQLWFSPTLLLLFIRGTYYDNNNDYKMVEYIRNYEIVNLFLEYFYINPYVVRSSMIFHHIIVVIGAHTLVLSQGVDIPLLRNTVYMSNITITTNLLLDMVQTFHKNNLLKIVFLIYFFVVRLVIPFPFIFNISTGHYLSITPSENIPVSIFISCGMYTFYGLNMFWFYKICRIARKYIV